MKSIFSLILIFILSMGGVACSKSNQPIEKPEPPVDSQSAKIRYNTFRDAQSGRLNFHQIKRFIEDGNDINNIFDDEDDAISSPISLLATASQYNQMDRLRQIKVVEVLLEAGADVNGQSNGRTALIWASDKGYLEIVKLLLRAGADPNIETESGHTALLMALNSKFIGANTFTEAYRDRKEIVRLLLMAGANVDHKDHRDKARTPLQWAIYINNIELVRLFLLAGANPYNVNTDTDVTFATDPEILRLLTVATETTTEASG